MAALIDTSTSARRLHPTSGALVLRATVSVVAFALAAACLPADSTAFRGGSERDRAMAGRLRDAIAGAPHDLFLVLTGNVHTRLRQGVPWDPSYEPMGFVLTHSSPKLAIAALDVAYTGGSAWICETPQPASCGAKPLKGRPDAGAIGVTLAPSVSAEGYSGFYSVGALTASPPAMPPTGHDAPHAPVSPQGVGSN